jgi:hypothetical protein
MAAQNRGQNRAIRRIKSRGFDVQRHDTHLPSKPGQSRFVKNPETQNNYVFLLQDNYIFELFLHAIKGNT